MVFTDHRESVVRLTATRMYAILDCQVAPVDLAAQPNVVMVTTLVLEASDALHLRPDVPARAFRPGNR